MATLAHIRQYLQHNYLNLDYLKLDIGGNEWLVLDHLIRSPILGKIKQIGAKLHLGTEENEISEDDDRLNIIRKLEEKGFVRFFARRIFGLTGKEFIFEVAWFNANYSQPPSDGWSDKAINDDVFLNEIQPFHSFSQPWFGSSCSDIILNNLKIKCKKKLIQIFKISKIEHAELNVT